MKTIVDTCSLVCLAKYYHPFDNTNVLDSFLRTEVGNGSIIILDKVINEVKGVSQGIAYDTFPFLKDKKNVKSTMICNHQRSFSKC